MGSPAAPSFRALFGEEPAVRAHASGRVNVIGEHTDYNGGFVLPAAIPQRTVVELRPATGRTVTAWTRDISTGERQQFTLGEETPRRAWIDYVQGITHVLAGDGHGIGAFQLRIESGVPVGSGLSSSAALEIGVLRALREAFGLELTDTQLALIGQRVENEFVGAPVGIMDQMACALAGDRSMLFLDTRTLAYEEIPLPESAQLLVIDSGIAHSHASGEYRTRRAECMRAASLLGVPQLRDVSVSELDRVAALPQPLDRRARHVVTENARVLETVEAFRSHDLSAAGRLLSASHRSMRDDFEVSIPDIDLLVQITEEQRGIFGARLTGGGFGGSIVALAARDAASYAGELVRAEYSRRSGRAASVLVPKDPPGR
jgi:galactokinase